MNKQVLFIIIWCCLGSIELLAQSTQWATEVISFSSQFSQSNEYSSRQVLGLPDGLEIDGNSIKSWIPRKDENEDGEYIHVGFDEAMPIQQIAVVESKNPGAIQRIFVYDIDGEAYLIFENAYPKSVLAPYRVFRHNFPLTDYPVKEIKIELNTTAVSGSNQIDAIGISALEDPINIKETLVAVKSAPIAVEEEDPFEEIEETEAVIIQHAAALNNALDLGDAINSNYSEENPYLSPDGQTLYFSRKNHPQNFGENSRDIWVSYKQDYSWSRPINLGLTINNERDNFVFAASSLNELLYVSNTYGGVNEGIASSTKKGRIWSKPNALNIADYENFSNFSSFSMSNDGKVLLMAVERNEGAGQMDIFVSFKQKNNNWSSPKSLGNAINTSGSESSVFLAVDNKTIYFSSNGHPGFGGLDMFMSQRLDNTWTNWSKPRNLGSKVNTTENDYNYTFPASGEVAYFPSGTASKGIDIFSISIPAEFRPDPVLVLTGSVYHDNNRRLASKIKCKNLSVESNSPFSKESALQSNRDGQFQLILPYGSDISLYIEDENFLPASRLIQLSDQPSEELDSDAGNTLAAKGFENSSDKVERLRFQLNKTERELNQLIDQRATQIFHKKLNTNDISDKTYRTDLSRFEQNYRDEFEFKQRGAPNQKEDSNQNADSELERMKQKFNKHNNKDGDNLSEKNKDPFGSKENADDDELEKMKRKLKDHSDAKDEEAYLFEEEETDVIEEEITAKSPPKFNFKDAPDFLDFRDQIYNEMRQENQQKILLSLLKTHFDKVKRKLKKDLNETDFNNFDVRLSDKAYAALEGNLPDKVMAAQQIALAKSEQKREADEVLWDFEQELRGLLREESNQDLSEFYLEQVKESINTEFLYLLKQKEKKKIEAILKVNIEEQIINEKQDQTEQGKGSFEEAPVFQIRKKEYRELSMGFEMAPIEVDRVFALESTFFRKNETVLKEISNAELGRLIRFLQNNPNLYIEISVHTNAWCSHEFALQLTNDRAKAIADFLVDRGIEMNRLQFKGLGKTVPIASNDTPEGRLENQRIIIRIIDIK